MPFRLDFFVQLVSKIMKLITVREPRSRDIALHHASVCPSKLWSPITHNWTSH